MAHPQADSQYTFIGVLALIAAGLLLLWGYRAFSAGNLLQGQVPPDTLTSDNENEQAFEVNENNPTTRASLIVQ